MAPDPSRWGFADLLPLGFVGGALLALAALSPESPGMYGFVGVVAVAAAAAMKRAPSPESRWFAATPLIATLGWLTMVAAPGPVAELWAAVGGLAVLAWIGVDPRAEPSVARPGIGLLVPAVGVGIAFVVAFVLPYGSGEQVGVAAGLIAAALGLSGWLYATAHRATADAAPAS